MFIVVGRGTCAPEGGGLGSIQEPRVQLAGPQGFHLGVCSMGGCADMNPRYPSKDSGWGSGARPPRGEGVASPPPQPSQYQTPCSRELLPSGWAGPEERKWQTAPHQRQVQKADHRSKAILNHPPPPGGGIQPPPAQRSLGGQSGQPSIIFHPRTNHFGLTKIRGVGFPCVRTTSIAFGRTIHGQGMGVFDVAGPEQGAANGREPAGLWAGCSSGGPL